MAKKKAYRFPLYLLARASAGLFAMLPRPVLLCLARVGGRLAFYAVGRQRKKTVSNLTYAFGNSKDTKAIKSIGRRVFENIAQTAAELLKFPVLNAKRISDIVDFGDTEEVYSGLLKQGKGLIALTAHIGNWELLAAAIISRGYPGTVVGRRIYYEPYNRWIVDLRKSAGVATVYRDSSARVLMRKLKKNEIIGILPDQDIDSLSGVFVDFLGRPAYTPVAPAKLAVATGAPILPNFLIRTPDGNYRFVISDPLWPQTDLPKDESVRKLTEEWMKAIEEVVRRYPEQWAWMHNRWKTQTGKPLERPEPRTADV